MTHDAVSLPLPIVCAQNILRKFETHLYILAQSIDEMERSLVLFISDNLVNL